MNLKQAKKARHVAKNMMFYYVTTELLTPDQYADASFDRIINALPARVHFMKGFTKVNGVATQRWFYKMAKKHPEWTEQDYITAIKGE